MAPLPTLADYARLAGTDTETASDAFQEAGQLVGNVPLKAGARLIRRWIEAESGLDRPRPDMCQASFCSDAPRFFLGDRWICGTHARAFPPSEGGPQEA